MGSTAADNTFQATDAAEPAQARLDGGLAGPPASTVASLIPAPSLRPVADEVSGLTDNAVQSVPLVSDLVPARTVAAVVDPAVGAADGVVRGTVGVAVPLADTVLAPLDPVLEPVVNAVPQTVPGPDAEPAAVLPVTADVTAARAPEFAPAFPPAAGLPETSGDLTRPTQAPAFLQGNGPESRIHTKLAAATPVLSKAGPEDAPLGTPSELPPAVPGAATGGSSSSGGNGPPAPAWISSHHYPAPTTGTASIQGRLLTTPAPASFDPGSSPD